jgi:hypothetical protein
MPTEVRSYALALWLFSKGHLPIDAGITPNGTLVFTFPPDASAAISSYNDAKVIFNGLEAHARVLHEARRRGGAA